MSKPGPSGVMPRLVSPPPSEPGRELAADEFRRLTRRSFTTGAIAALAGASGVGWLATRPLDDGIPGPLRRILEVNEQIAQALYGPDRLAPEFPREHAVMPRENGHVGLMSPAALDDWTVHLVGAADQHVPLKAVKELPAHEMTTEFKCVEGWSRIVRWKGVRLADLLQKYGAPSPYVGLSTPLDGVAPGGSPDRFMVGLDRNSAMHPQTLLAYEMNGEPLTHGHGAPLRLVTTLKYGYKQIKRVSVINLTGDRPPDYWALRGYDWYGGH